MGQDPWRPGLVCLLMVKCLPIPTPSLSGTGVSVLTSGHGEEDNPSNNKIIMIIRRTAQI